jgi:hypothetical protein
MILSQPYKQAATPLSFFYSTNGMGNLQKKKAHHFCDGLIIY